MGFLARIFGRKPTLATHKSQVCQMGSKLLVATERNFDTASLLEQAVIGTFFFGMAYAHGHVHKLAPAQVHALALIAYSEVFHYTPTAAAEAVQHCIEATTPGVHDAMREILHKGIDGHAYYAVGNYRALKASVLSVIESFAREEPQPA